MGGGGGGGVGGPKGKGAQEKPIGMFPEEAGKEGEGEKNK